MDKTDLEISLLLSMNSRTPYRELASKTGLSINAVHRRIQLLKEAGVIGAMTAKPSFLALNATMVVIFGRSEAKFAFEDYRRLGNDDHTLRIGVCGGDNLFVHGLLRNISELGEYVAFVKKTAAVPNPTVGIVTLGLATQVENTLKALDYQIIYSLHKDSRKEIPEIAEELGVSAKTVRRRLTNMIRGYLIELSMDWYPEASHDSLSIMSMQLKDSADKMKALTRLRTEYSPNMIWFWMFSNLPNLVMGMLWTKGMKELQDTCKRLQIEDFDTVTPNVLCYSLVFDTWRDKLVLEKGAPNRRKT
jgi:DNA-binding Lrp family transcriptional regulator